VLWRSGGQLHCGLWLALVKQKLLKKDSNSNGASCSAIAAFLFKFMARSSDCFAWSSAFLAAVDSGLGSCVSAA